MGFKKSGRVVVITGGATGIGKEIALLYAGAGHDVAIISRNTGALELAHRDLSRYLSGEQKTQYFVGDVTDKQSIKKALKEVLAFFGQVDTLILSAGGGAPGYFEDHSEQRFRDYFELNFFGTLYPVQEVLPQMKERGSGKIVIISSGAALMGIFGNAAYGSSKFAVRGLGETLRWECRPFRVQVSMAYPPVTDTPMYHRNKDLKTWENKLIVNKNKAFPVDKVAKSIYKGIEKGKPVITTGASLYFLYRVGGALMPLVHWYFDRKIMAGRKKRGLSA